MSKTKKIISILLCAIMISATCTTAFAYTVTYFYDKTVVITKSAPITTSSFVTQTSRLDYEILYHGDSNQSVTMTLQKYSNNNWSDVSSITKAGGSSRSSNFDVVPGITYRVIVTTTSSQNYTVLLSLHEYIA